MSQPGTARLIENLTARGRKGRRKGLEGEAAGYGLIETNDWIVGRRPEVYVLTDKGRECVREMIRALNGQAADDFSPHDVESLFPLLIREMMDGRRKR